VSTDLDIPEVQREMVQRMVERRGARRESHSTYDYVRDNLVKGRESELFDAMAKNPAITNIGKKIAKADLTPLLRRHFSDDEIRDAKETFTKVLDKFVEKGVDFSTAPLSETLGLDAWADLVPSIVKDLYKNEVTAFAKKLADPLADSLFRMPPVPPEVGVEKVIEIAGRRTFDGDSLPERVIKPTYDDRVDRAREDRAGESSTEAGERSIRGIP
jgi:hypothetical protein